MGEESSSLVVASSSSTISISDIVASYKRLPRDRAAEDTMTFGLSPPTGSCEEAAAYVDMNCSPQGHPRTLTIESGISEISLLPPETEEALLVHVDDQMEVEEERCSSRSVDIPAAPPLASGDSC